MKNEITNAASSDSSIEQKLKASAKKIMFTIKRGNADKVNLVFNPLSVVKDEPKHESSTKEAESLMTLNDIYSSISKSNYASSSTEEAIILYWFRQNGIEVNHEHFTLRSSSDKGSELFGEKLLWVAVCLYYFYYSKQYQTEFSLEKFIALSNAALEHLDESACCEYIDDFFKVFIRDNFSDEVIEEYVKREKVKGYQAAQKNYEVFLKRIAAELASEEKKNSFMASHNKKSRAYANQSKSPKPKSLKTTSQLSSIKKYTKKRKTITKNHNSKDILIKDKKNKKALNSSMNQDKPYPSNKRLNQSFNKD